MNAEYKKKWVEALRSGEYRQGRNYLSLNGNFCCLGVLCEIHPEVKRNGFGRGFGYRVGDELSLTQLPPYLRFTLGIDEDTTDILINFNDEDGLSFSEIADWIEANL